MHPHAFHQGILETLARSPAHRVHGLRALALAVAGQQPSPNAEIDIAREIAIAAELLALRGLISIDRARGQAAFSLTQLGQAFMRPPRAKAAAPALAGAVALTTALTGCASIIAPAAPPSAAAPSLHDLRQLAPARIEQVVDPYNGLAYFARCSDCATPTPKTLASESGAASADITRFIPPDVLGRARGAEGGALPVQRKQMSQSAESPSATFVERRYVVYFRFADAGVNPVAQVALQKIASQLTGAKSILIVGSTDSTGSMATNQRLADRRAQAVSAVLSKAGVPGSTIATKADPNRAGGAAADATAVGKVASSSPAAMARHAEIVALVPVSDARVASLSR